jgi:hypothetical protein
MKPLVSLYLQSLKPYISRLSLPLLLRFLVLKHVQDFAGLASKAYLGDWNQSLSFNLLYPCKLNLSWTSDAPTSASGRQIFNNMMAQKLQWSRYHDFEVSSNVKPLFLLFIVSKSQS